MTAPSEATEIPSLPATSNVLCVRGARHSQTQRQSSSSLFVTFADRSLIEISSSPPYQRFTDVASLHNGPILSLCPTQDGCALTTSMSGQLIFHGRSGTGIKILGRRSDHSKYAVQVAATVETDSCWIVATAGWDQRVHIYATPDLEAHGFGPATTTELLGDPVATISLPSNPESFVFVRHPDTNALYIVLSRRDSTHLYYYQINPSSAGNPCFTVREAGKQNLAPHASAWIAFSPSCLALSPTDPTRLAVATSHLPHMKLIIVRLLFPDGTNALSVGWREPPEATQASQARAALALSDREDAAISLHVSTMAPQTPYSTPQVVWRPDGSGVWVNGDDGVVRGIEVMAGKVVALLKGHEPGSKVRSLWAGMVNVIDGDRDGAEEEAERMREEEWLVSGGFDKKVIVWKVGSHETAVDRQ
jgi:WD40 repeat protein